MNFELLKGWMNETFSFLNSNLKETAITMLMIELLSMVPMVITIIMAAAVVILAPPGLELLAMTIAAVFVIAGAFISGGIASVQYNAVDNITKRRKTRMIATAEENLIPFIKYSLVMIGIYLVPILPIIVVLIAAYVIFPLVGSLMEILVRILIGIISAIIYLFLQFAIFEAMVSRNGTLDSYRKSYGMAKKNIFPTIIMAFLLWIVETVISIAFVVAIVVVALVLMILVIGGIGAGIEAPEALIGALAWPVIAIAIAVLIVIAVIVQAVTKTILYPAQYFFWKKIKY
jgi:hypothetical protein